MDGFECVPAATPTEAAAGLYELAATGAVDAIVRGQLDYTTYHRAMNEALRLRPARHGVVDLMCPYLLRDPRGDEWLITPVVQHDDATVEGKVYLSTCAAAILAALGVRPKIGVLAGDEREERGYLPSVDQSIDEALAVVDALRGVGLEADFFGLRVDNASALCNVVVPTDGTVGNFIYRSLGYIGGAELVGAITLSNRIVSLDTSRYNDCFGLAVQAATALKNLGGCR